MIGLNILPILDEARNSLDRITSVYYKASGAPTSEHEENITKVFDIVEKLEKILVIYQVRDEIADYIAETYKGSYMSVTKDIINIIKELEEMI